MKIFTNKVFKNYFTMMLALTFLELIFRLVMKLPILDWACLRIFLEVNIISLVLSTIFSFCGRILGDILSFVATLIFTIYAIGQAGFENYLGVYVSFGTSSQLGAVTDYFKDYLDSFNPKFWLMLIPVAAMGIFYIFFERRFYIIERNEIIDFSDKFDSLERKEQNEKERFKFRKKIAKNSKINAMVMAVVLGILFYLTLTLSFMQNDIQLKSTKSLLLNPDMPNIAVGQFGIASYGLLDIKSTLMPSSSTTEESYDTYKKVEQVKSDYTRYIDDTTWESLIKDETNSNYKTLSNYYISQKITDKNDYTGMFKDKNLIVIMMESTSTIAINQKYFPNLYKIYNEGWSWTNAYSPRNSCSTGNNEMSGMTSLYTINNTCTANIYKNNKYPESLFNLFKNAGYTTSSYHNYTEKYYARKTIHPNMGSDHYYGVTELGIPYSNAYKEWPSDVELMDKFLNITEDQDKFMAWITTVSSHQPYTQDSELGNLYLDMFKDTNYDMSLKRYLSKLKVLDNALGELLDGLKEQGKLDDTVIVLYGDHYPYGLTDSTINQYMDYDVSENNEVDRTPFVIYNSGLTATKHDEYTTYMNIVPTVANLFGLDYDPRLYAGTDLLSKDYVSRAYFANGSWQDEKAYYNATTGKISLKDENNGYTAEEIQEINKQINEKIHMSNLAIKTNYFEYLNSKIHPEKELETTEKSKKSS